MAISTTRSFNPDVADLLEDAFQLAGTEMVSGNDLATGRRVLNYLLLEWANKGINLWTIDNITIPSATIVAGTYEYDVDIDTIAVIKVMLRTGSGTYQSDVPLYEVSAVTYAQINNKLTRGKPSQFWLSRIGVRDVTDGVNRPSKLVLWPVPDVSNTYSIVYTRMRRMADAGRGGLSTLEIPDRFIPAMRYGLALGISLQKPGSADRVPLLQMLYDRTLNEAMDEDRERQDFTSIPDLSGYSPY